MIMSLRRPRYEQLVAIHESQVARPDVGLAIIWGKFGHEGLFGFGRTLPISLATAGAVDPNFANLIVGQRTAGFGMHDQDFFFLQHLAAANQLTGIFVIFRGWNHSVLDQPVFVERPDDGSLSALSRL